MSCTKQTTTGNIWKYIVDKIQQQLNAESVVSYVNGVVKTTISKSGVDTVVLTIGPVTFTRNIQIIDPIDVITTYKNITVAQFRIIGVTANQGQQYVIVVYFTYS